MRYNPDIHHRRSIRLRGHDYSKRGAYFLTICTYHRDCLFGSIQDEKMILNGYGEIVQCEWLKSAKIRSEIELGDYVVMPNHFHGIVVIAGHKGNQGDPQLEGDPPVAPTIGLKTKSIGSMMAGFKAAITHRINLIRETPGQPVWQRNYYEHVIRSEADYANIAQYIANNPRCWTEDSLHPDKP